MNPLPFWLVYFAGVVATTAIAGGAALDDFVFGLDGIDFGGIDLPLDIIKAIVLLVEFFFGIATTVTLVGVPPWLRVLVLGPLAIGIAISAVQLAK